MRRIQVLCSGMLEELLTRMRVVVEKGRYLLATDILGAFLPLLYVGDGLSCDGDKTDDCGADFLERLALNCSFHTQALFCWDAREHLFVRGLGWRGEEVSAVHFGPACLDFPPCPSRSARLCPCQSVFSA